MKKALIIGVTGQDGSYLASYLLSLGYKVVGTTRNRILSAPKNLKLLEIDDEVELRTLQLTDFNSLLQLVSSYQPDEIYNLGGMTSVSLSFQKPADCFNSIINATTNLLEVIKLSGGSIRFFNAGSSECFGTSLSPIVDENEPFRPVSPYGVAKSSSFWQISTYRNSYGIHCCTGIFSNHESPLRPKNFVVSKIINTAKAIRDGKVDHILLGNIDIYRDWGWAFDYVKAMHLMINSNIPNDYIIATGVSTSLREIAEKIFSLFDLDLYEYLRIDQKLIRPSELVHSRLSPKKISTHLSWKATHNIDQILFKLSRGELY